ncbi:MAG: coniferyl aldehyde dehydrogenase [Myxococcota bacterium]|nr:coniferyl aldehyde dehydrogenase [Myxococcota bacterium]
MDAIETDLNAKLESLRAAQLSGGIPSVAVRKARLQKCIDLLVDNQEAIVRTLDADYAGRPEPLTLMSEVMMPINHLKDALKNVSRWMKPERRKAPFPLGLFGARAELRYQPKGVVGIMSPWNFPMAMIFNPLSNALAAGNRVMIKPSEFNPATVDLLEELFPKYFAEDEVALVTGGPEVGAAFSRLPLDHILFTGATSIGRKVMEAASRNLTPVTLELGGKSPVIVSSSADIGEAASRIITGKCNNAGQVCLSPDYAFVPAGSVDAFIDTCRETLRAQYPTVLGNRDYTAMINDRHYARINMHLAEAREAGLRVENLGTEEPKEGDRRIPVHLVVDPGEELAVMNDEIFGPILVVKSYEIIDECVTYINARPTPLGLYYFGKDRAEKERVLESTRSGGVTVNEVIMHVACVDMPFGGVGNSGIGNYHGREGFKTFSHARGVYTEGKLNLAKLAGSLPPYGDKVKRMLASQIKK